jgi:hypothetical protein
MTKRLIAIVLGGVLVVAACGSGGGDGAGVASLSGDQTSDGSDRNDDEATPEEAEEAFREYARCMREHGVDMPDPQFDGQGGGLVQIGPGPGEAGDEPDRAELDAAEEACGHLIDDVVRSGPQELDPEEEAEMRDRALAFARCMREHGIDMPDPEFGDNGMVTQALPGPVDDDEFREAQEACAEEAGMGPFVGGVRAGGDE